MKNLRKNEKGVALLIALFALLLLSAVGLSMMFSADSETSINSNYRDKQQVSYAALSGALEAKDRIQPSNTTSPSWIPFPTDAPNTSTQQVWYIVNPGLGESMSDIQPWSATVNGKANPYMDTEICHETGLATTFGLSCSSTPLPSGNWYIPYDNSAGTYLGAYKLGNPLQYKWARIQLKTVDSGPVTVAGGASGQVVCWDGHNQIPQPSSYGKDCKPVSGTVGSISISNGGSGYSSAPTVSFSGGGGSGAQATAVIGATGSGAVSSLTLTSPGTGYITQPTVTITGDGSGATALANLNGGNVSAVNLTSAGTMCYQTAPSVAITGGGGSGATAVANLESATSCVISVSNGTCSDFKNNTYDVTILGGNNDAVASIFFKNGTGDVKNTSVVIKNPGTGYSANPTGLSYSGTNCPSGSSWTLGKRIASFTVTNGGSGYTTPPTVTIGPGTGTLATLPTATATTLPYTGPGTPGAINNIVLTNGGSGYTYANVTISGGAGSGAAATATVSPTNHVVAINVTNGGSGYTSAPIVTLNGGGCTTNCASGVAFLANGVIYGQVLQITSLAVSRSGSRAMTQMEVATPPAHQLGVTGALTLAGPAVDSNTAYNPPLYESTNSNPFHISGIDQNSCAETANTPLPAIGVYDDPDNPTSPTAQTEVINSLGKPANYVGANSAPDVEDIYTALGDTNTPADFEAFTNTVVKNATQTPYPSGVDPTTVNMGSPTAPAITVVDGNMTIGSGTSRDGYGVLLVRGKLTVTGQFHWHGVLLVIGQGEMEVSGGGGGEVDGTVILARTRDASGNLLTTLGTPHLDWSGGGGNGIYYDHCWADKMLQKIQFNPGPTTLPLKILSTRTVSY